MSEGPAGKPPAPPPAEQPPDASVTGLQTFYERAGGLFVPVAAAFLAFLIGGIVVLITEKSISAPFEAYKAIFEGTGLTWFVPGGNTAEEARDLQQTLLITTPLILAALAVAFAFRCGMFNIGGQGQYWVGLLTAIYVGTHFSGTPRVLHVTLTLVLAIVAGAIWGGIAGILKATVGAHEVISTIMLNWIAIWVGKWLLESPDGFLQGSDPTLPRSNDVLDSSKLPEIWGRLQPLHAGIFIALFALVVYHLLLNRTTLGYEVRAVGFNPDAAAYSGINVKRSYFLALAIAGAFAGLAGAVDLAGWKFRLTSTEFDANLLGFTGIAVALLGRNKAVGILFAALLFGALQVGTSPRQLDPEVFNPELATNLATMIQALIIAFVGAEFLILYLWRSGRRLRPGPRRVQPELKA
ncbi:MAG TPA: ABC transporter permease [Gaiellaceae bacterium]|nr:ABC transporter permease [Gaiellaceae bacterium]